MNKFLKKVEKINSSLIIPALILLLFLIIFELFYHTDNHTLHLIVKILDYLVITIFVIDLIFLWFKAKNVKFFFKNNWLDILAVFPFGLFFKAISQIYRLAITAERIAIGQAFLHELTRSEKIIKVLSQSERFSKFIKVGARSLRLITKSRLFERFHATFHHDSKKSS